MCAYALKKMKHLQIHVSLKGEWMTPRKATVDTQNVHLCDFQHIQI